MDQGNQQGAQAGAGADVMRSGPHNFPLGKPKADELAAALKEAKRKEATTFLGVWCPESAFCVGVAVHDGAPGQWYCQGPMSQAEAGAWFDRFLSPATPCERFH